MKVLQIVETAYRATIEEQDDTVLWITHAMRGAGADLCVLLSGNAVNYAVAAQDASGLKFGTWRQSEPPRLPQEVGSLMAKGVPVHAVAEDLEERGLARDQLLEGVQILPRRGLAGFLGQFERVWRW